jgi:hypothetical protein
MSGGYRGGQPPTELAGLILELEQIGRRLDTLERPSGEQLAQVVEELTALVNDIQAQLDDYIANGTYNKAQIDAKIASPGNIAPGNVTASGTVSGAYGGDFSGGLRSTGAYATNLSGGGAYNAAWIHLDGRVGYVPSSRRFKTDIRPARFSVADVLRLEAFYYRYIADVPYSQELQPEMLSLLAEDSEAAGFPWLVTYDEEGKPFGVRHDLVAGVVLEGMRSFYAEFQDLAAEVATLTSDKGADDQGE